MRPSFSVIFLRAVAFMAGLGLLGSVARGVVYVWTDGDIQSGSPHITPGTVSTLSSGDTLNITTTADHNFNAFTLTNNGTINWQSGNLRSGNGGVINNNNVWNDTANYQINNAYGGTPLAFNNFGTYNKLSGSSEFAISFTNNGAIAVTGGTLLLSAGATFANNSSATVTGGGVLQFGAGNFVLNQVVTLDNVLFTGGTISGDQTLFGTLLWQNGDFNSGNTTTIGGGATIQLTTSADKNFNSHAFLNYGTINWTDGNLRTGNGGSITNHGQWNDTAVGQVINNAFGGTLATYTNASDGTYQKSGAGTTTLNVPFYNHGQVLVSSGTLDINAGGTIYGGSTLSSSGSGVLELTGGTLSGANDGAFAANNFLFTGGTVGDGLLIGGTATWTASDFSTAGTTTVNVGSSLTLTTGADKNFNAHTFVIQGDFYWGAGNLRSGNGGTITNHHNFYDAADTYNMNNGFGGTSATFTNAIDGTYTKITGSSVINIPFFNYGSVVVNAGSLSLGNGGVFYGGSSISSPSGVAQLTGGTLTGSGGAFTANNFVFAGGVVGDGLMMNGTATWISTDFSTAGTTTILGGATLAINNAVDHNYNGHAFVNYGTVQWSNGDLRSGNAGSITNHALWTDTSSNQMNNAFGGTGAQFINASDGTYLKTSGASLISDGLLNNSGVISVTGGTLDLNGGALNNGSSIGSSGGGLVELVAGVLTMNGTIAMQNFTFNGGGITGTHTLTGTINWLNGNWSGGSSVTTIGSTGTLTIANAVNHDFNAHAIVNNGTINWSQGDLRSGNAGTITNNATWNDTATNEIDNAFGGTLATFHNASGGVYVKSAGTSTFNNGVLINDGTISVTGGTLNLVGGTLNSGSSIGSSASGLVQLASGVLTAIGTINVSHFVLAGGELTGNQTFEGTLAWNGGDLNTAGTMTIGTTGVFDISTPGNHDFNAHGIVNNGILNWNQGDLRSGNGGTITNNGTWNDATSNVINNAFGGTTATYVNGATGIYQKTGGTSQISIPFTNQGTLTTSGGSTLTFNSTFASSTGRVIVGSGTTLSSATPLTFDAGSHLNGSGLVSVSSVAMNGEIAPGTGVASGQLTLSNNLALSSTAQATFGIGGTTVGSQYDQLVVTGTNTLAGNLAVYFRNGFNTSVDGTMTFTLMADGALSGVFANVANGSRLMTTDSFGSFVVNYGAGSPFGANNVVLSNFIPVPEPSTWLLLLAGAFSLLAVRRYRR